MFTVGISSVRTSGSSALCWRRFQTQNTGRSGASILVYRPDWRTEERRDYTLAVAGILARLLPAGVPGSISTLPGSYVVVPESNTAPIPKTTGFFVYQSGRFTGQLVLGNSTYAVSGKLDESGRATQQVRTMSGPVTMKLASAEISKVRVLDVSVTETPAASAARLSTRVPVVLLPPSSEDAAS